ncbi:restriction endonuclease [Actinomycetes bacterium KLBMP 9797]
MHAFENLSDYDFEQLVADLLSAEWGIAVDLFPRGRDGGVDLRALGPTGPPLDLGDGDELVVQCKHRPLGAYSSISATIARDACNPIVEQASRYIIATSARLIRANKDKIVSLFDGKIDVRDIIAREDIEGLLRRHPSVERANLKLWLTSTAALQAIGARTETLRSAALRSELERLRSTFVETAVVRRANEILRRHGVCILTGPPGVGKTATASVLLLKAMADGFLPVAAIGDVRELEDQVVPGEKQVLFFDDFLGKTRLDAKLRKGEDGELVRLMHHVERDESKLFILTTRDYILQQARISYEKLGDELVDVAKVAVDARGLSSPERAHILFNQLYFSPIRSLAAGAADAGSRYERLAHHRNFNPRLIEVAIMSIVRSSGLSTRTRHSAEDRTQIPLAIDVPRRISEALDAPENLWNHVLRNQISRLELDLLPTLWSFGSALVLVEDLFRAVGSLQQVRGRTIRSIDFEGGLHVLDGDLVQVERSAGLSVTTVSFANPGVLDALTRHLQIFPDDLNALLSSASFFEQVEPLARLTGVLDSTSGGAVQATNKRPIQDLTRVAEQSLIVPPTIAERALFTFRASQFGRFSRRLDVLGEMYLAQDAHAPASLGEQVIELLANSVHQMRSADAINIASSLRAGAYETWQSHVWRFDAALLEALGWPDDLESWSTLADAFDVVGPNAEHVTEAESLFETFAADIVEPVVEYLHDPASARGLEVGATLEQLERLQEVGARWGYSSFELAYAVERLEEMTNRESRPWPAGHHTLFEGSRSKPSTQGSIFDLL